MKVKLGIIGGGNMGSAIVQGCLRADIVPVNEIVVAEIDANRRHELEKIGVRTVGTARHATAAEQVLLAVKPQSFASVAAQLGSLDRDTIVISIMAGIHSASIRAALGGKVRVIRAMPNVACQIGAGMTAVALGDGARPDDGAFARSVFSAMGLVVTVEESLMYAVTAVSASGLAYVYFLAEAMEQAAVKLGFDQTTARLLVYQTAFGAGRMLVETNQDAVALRQAVTSPGGTTAAAIDVMNNRQFQSIVLDALTAARDRGVTLGQSG